MSKNNKEPKRKPWMKFKSLDDPEALCNVPEPTKEDYEKAEKAGKEVY